MHFTSIANDPQLSISTLIDGRCPLTSETAYWFIHVPEASLCYITLRCACLAVYINFCGLDTRHFFLHVST